ncbi:hypothetical protein AYK26_03910 [Euryarchaeota archaeon SM23-78]|nr:MAG: hypothetical protein AYK26_03910 [Euryarchaeota archaeon SM23-78]
MKKEISTTLLIFGFLAVFSLMAVFVWADSDEPFGVTNIAPGASSRPDLSSYPPSQTEAEAGNITELNLTAISTTKAWQGYYGEITGTLTLEDSSGNVFYNWSTMEPKGEIYACINNTINWSAIACFEFDGSNGFTVDTAEGWFGIQDDDSDGINETFTDNMNLFFKVGTHNITTNTCPATNAYQNGAPVNENFENVLLTDTAVLIFTTIIENNVADNSTDIVGFDGVTHDFQLLVAENGQDGFEDTTTTYYFWAEIE